MFLSIFLYIAFGDPVIKRGGENCDPSLSPPPYAGLSTLSKVEGYFEKVGGERRAMRGN